MTILVQIVSIAAAINGVVSAALWWWAASVPILTRGDWSGNPVLNQLDRENQAIAAWMESGRRNKRAAVATGLSAILSGAAIALGAFS